ncbi:MAG TPA: neutral/alkaline non-lysosomal ceramidase N-terminal domain-containing protein [Clostridia bacterium]|nr:neutral/alkaline non-lysosomal ceramidase N-terminal domain-containing protein [Clostridia bacterium]
MRHKHHRTAWRVARAVLIAGMALHVAGVCWAVEFSAGAARAEITPDVRMTNWITHKAYGEVLDPVYARALVLGQGTNRVVIVSWELLYPMEGAVAKVRQEIARKTGIATSDILVSATHNHSAPWSPVLGDPLTKPEQKVLHSFLNDPLYPAWADKVIRATVDAVKKADAARQPAVLAIGRGYIGDVIFNRRPIKPDGTVQGMATPADPYALPGGLRFGVVDPTLTVLVLRNPQQQTIATVFNMPCHAVAVYPNYDGISADWPGPVSAALQQELGGEAIFLQGCAGDVVPVRRGVPARDTIAKVVTERVLAATKTAQLLPLQRPFQAGQERVKAPVTEMVRQDTGRDFFTPEVQVLSCGPLALVGLPGEPLIRLAMTIQERSPFPHTLVIGYANGYGVQYVGMPGDKARGGYEMGARGLGTDECGQLLMDAAVRLLEAQYSAATRLP